MRTIITLLIAFLAIPLTAAEDGPELPRGAERALERYEKDAAKAQAEYDEAMAEAVEEVLEELADEQVRATKAGDLETALAVRAKIEELTPDPKEGADLIGVQDRDQVPAVREITVDARSDGVSLGELSAGETLIVSYISGEWQAYPSWPMESPDRAPKSAHRMVLVGPDGDHTPIPHDTARKPYQTRVTEPGEYHLRIGDRVLGGNSGNVTYKVGVR